MKTYPYSYEVPLHWTTVQVSDGHPITGSKEYERAYYKTYLNNLYERCMVLSKMKDKGWILCRTVRYEYGGIEFTWYRKKNE